ncbi:MAG: hypothetical protein J5586_03330 [Clostridia bacterium]|nr:hypothetical protein [Clostridia bacterium]
MKKAAAFVLILAALCAVLTGCTAIAENWPFHTPVPGPTKFPITDTTMDPIDPGTLGTLPPQDLVLGDSLYWDAFRAGGTEAAPYYKVYSDYAAFIKEVPQAKDFGEHYDERSFGKIFVVAVYYTVNTGGYKVGPEAIRANDEKITIDIAVTPPAADSLVTQAFETHCVLVAFDAERFPPETPVELLFNGYPMKPASGETR